MFNIFKKSKGNKGSSSFNLSSTGKKKSILDFFKINLFILFTFFLLIVVTALLVLLIGSNKILIDKRGSEQAQKYSKLIEVKNTLGYLNGLKVQKFDGTNIVKILNYLEELNFHGYKLEFNSNKQYFYVNLKAVSEDKLNNIIEKGVKSGTLNYFKTNETIKVIEEGRVSITLIFN